MKYEEFAANFANPEPVLREAATSDKSATAGAVIAGTVVSAHKDLLHLDINGVQYELDPAEVIDVQLLAKPTAETCDKDRQEDAKGAAEASPATPSNIVLINAHCGAVLYRRVAVPAAQIAALGTWVHVVPAASEAA
ncbi:MAG TPA: hypothetical protein VGC27_00345 [Rhizomicrobium sp.]